MSGPKTSELEIERQRRERIAQIRETVLGAGCATRRALRELAKELKALCDAVGADDERASIERMLDEFSQRLNALERVDLDFSIEDAGARSASAQQEMHELVAEATRQAQSHLSLLRARAGRQRDEVDADAFAEALGSESLAGDASALQTLAALKEHARTEQQTGSRERSEDGASSASEEQSREDDARILKERLEGLLPSPALLGDDRALALEAHNLIALSLQEGCAGDQDVAACCAQIACTLPRVEANMEAAQTLLDRVDALQRELARRGITTNVASDNAPYSSIDDIGSHADVLTQLLREADERDYMRACIDEAMRRHGYDVARSASLGPANLGDHTLFSRSEAPDEGIHAFVSNSGDLMLEVVGIAPGALDAPAAQVRPAQSPARRLDLLKSQEDFCAVYAEIERDLAEFGIRSAARHKASPSLDFSREVVATNEASTGADPVGAQVSERTSRREHRARTAPAAREMR